MDSALVAVVGTLGGVALTSLAGLLTALLAGRNQRSLSQIQLSHEQTRLDRQERRSAYVAFLEAYDTAFAKAKLVFDSGGAQDVQEADWGVAWTSIAKEEMGKLQRGYLVITITAGAEVRKAANDCLGSIWKLGDAALAGDRDGFGDAVRQSQEPRDRLREAMRDELDVG